MCRHFVEEVGCAEWLDAPAEVEAKATPGDTTQPAATPKPGRKKKA